MSRSDPLTVTGLVLSSRPAGEYDRRIVLLTRELGRISCFANGARRLNNPLASVDSFCFGTFTLREGRSAYAIQEARITARFTEVRQDIEASIICEKDSHKGIVIGKGGAMLRKIGTAARTDIENMLQSRVNLKLFVKVRRDWKDNELQMKNFGYDPKKYK